MTQNIASSPNLNDFVRELRQYFFSTLNCVQVGRIVSYNAAERTASIQIMVKRKITDRLRSYPLLVRCPVCSISGGDAEVYMPIAEGDDCIVLFSDRNLDIWHIYGTESKAESSRMHDLADGIAIVGIRSIVNPPDSRTSGEAGIANNEVRLGLANNKANIENATTSLLALLEGLIDEIKTMTITDPVSGPISVSAGSIASLEAYKTTIQGLLYED